jgi:hypothetical protein
MICFFGLGCDKDDANISKKAKKKLTKQNETQAIDSIIFNKLG